MIHVVAAELCQDCGRAGLETRGFCPSCGSRRITLGTISGEATIHAITRIHRPPKAGAGPYSIALLALCAGPRLMAQIPDHLRVGDTVFISRPGLTSPETLIHLAPAD